MFGSVSEAAQRYNLDRTELTQPVDAGKIVAAVPDWVAEEILSASEHIGEDKAAVWSGYSGALRIVAAWG